jgi:transcriptional regulator with XRE-family HTH domain
MLAMASELFAKWLQERMELKGYNQAELARRAGVSRAAINGVLTGSRNPGNDLCSAVAKALNIRPEIVFRAAGILPNQPGMDEDYEELKHLFSQMTDEEQEEFLATGRLKLELRNKRGELREKQQARPAHV